MSINHRVGVFAACSCIIAAAAASGAGYLSSTGPVALRFQPQVRPGTKSNLPPVPAPEAETTAAVSPALINTNAESTVSTAASQIPTGEPLMATNGVELTPQMFVEVFRSRCKGGAAHDAGVIVPMGFVPPTGQTPPTRGTSTAVYQSQ
jgi:hypothetical protein